MTITVNFAACSISDNLANWRKRVTAMTTKLLLEHISITSSIFLYRSLKLILKYLGWFPLLTVFNLTC